MTNGYQEDLVSLNYFFYSTLFYSKASYIHLKTEIYVSHPPLKMKYYYQKLPIHLGVAAILAGVGFLALRKTEITSHIDPYRLYGICFSLILAVVIYASIKLIEFKERKTHLRGTMLVDSKQFVAAIGGDGIAIPNNADDQEGPEFLQIKKEDENKHVLICGDTGSGKSAIFHYMVKQISMRPQETIVIYDPKLEYWKYHGNPNRGDVLLYPFSAQCPYWDLASEIVRPEMAKLIAESLLPCKPGAENDFFVRSPRVILEQLLIKLRKNRGSISDLLSWISEDGAIDVILDGNIAANYIPKDAPAQRGGVLASLSDVGAHLQLLPKASGRSRISLASWVKKRAGGWLFIGGAGVSDQQILQPLFSIWFNILIQHLLDTIDPNPPATWIFIDELASLKSLSFLEQAASQARSYNTRLVLGFQNKYQIESFYEKMAQPILSAPKTKIFLRTAEIDSAQWCARMIGEPEFEQRVLSESSQLSFDRRESISYRSERKTEYLVLPSEFSTLGDREGFLQYQGIVTPIAFDYPKLVARNEVKRELANPANF